jgi:solute carrier family 25 folate transporter 32
MTTSKRNVDERPHYVSFVAGVAGGSASTALLFPLDTIKVRMQVNEDKLRLATRTSVISAMRGVVRHEGFLGLYQGLAPALVASALSWGGYFYIYEGTKRRISGIDGVGEKETLTGMENFAAACLSGAAMVCVTNPIWLIKTRMQLQLRNFQDPLHVGGKVVRPYSGMLDAALTISRDEGPFAMYKGASVAMVMVSHGGIQFMCYEYLKQHFSKYLKLEREKKDLLGHERIGVLEKLEDSFGYLLMGAGSKM